MRTVHEVSKLTGVSVRTLHHYDSIGLLPPTKVSAAGYRLYDDTALSRLQTILLFRELQFPLKEIKTVLDSPNFDPEEALAQQINLLELQRKRLEELIVYAREIQAKGVNNMAFDVFDKSELEQYKQEARERWGSTAAYGEFEEKKKQGKDFGAAGGRMMEIFVELGALRGQDPDAELVQEKVKMLQAFITENFYTCTPEILRGLGQMYVGDERFRRNIDRAGGEGTAAFACEAIRVYCDSVST